MLSITQPTKSPNHWLSCIQSCNQTSRTIICITATKKGNLTTNSTPTRTKISSRWSTQKGCALRITPSKKPSLLRLECAGSTSSKKMLRAVSHLALIWTLSSRKAQGQCPSWMLFQVYPWVALHRRRMLALRTVRGKPWKALVLLLPAIKIIQMCKQVLVTTSLTLKARLRSR